MSNDDLHAAARRVADAAGGLLLEIRRALADGADPDTVRQAGDRRSNALIIELLREAYPDDGILSEEAPHDLRKDGAERLWIVDPLDGTREFGEPERDDWAVQVALLEHDRLVAGAVALPARAVTYSTSHPAAAATPSRPPLIAVSRTRPAAESVFLAKRLGGQLVPMGSAGVKAIAVLTGEVDIYLHSGGQYAWDSAAPVAVAAAAGLHTSRLDGSALVYGRDDPWLPDLLVCRPKLARPVIEALAQKPAA